jgi:2-(1,2-epoxy-1,2-dihydrophenyl)acetyl-CoA isomerase
LDAVISSVRRGNVRWIVIDNPTKKNALDRDQMVALTEVITEAGADPDTRVIVLRGAGKAFCTGADLTAAQGTLPKKGSAAPPADVAENRDAEFNVTIRTVWNVEKPVIAAVDGIAAGFGCSLALACDVRIASSAARFALIFVKRGLALDGGASFFLTRLAGLSGLEMALSGDVIDAEEALRLGIVNRVIPEAEFGAYIVDYAERMAKNAPLALAAIKNAVHDAMNTTLDDTLRAELVVVRQLARSEDVHEGVTAFLEKRQPVWRGR